MENNKSYTNGIHINLVLYICVCLIIYLNKIDKISFISDELTKILSVIIFLLIITNRKFKLDKIQWVWIISLFGMILSCIGSIDMKTSILYTVIYAIALLFMIYFSNNLETILEGITIQKYFCIVSMIFTIMALISKDIYLNLLKYIFNDLSIQDITMSINVHGRYSGIGRFCGNNAFTLSVGLGIIIFTIIEKKNFIKNSILFLLFSISLLLTGSRGMFVASSVSLLFVLFIRNSNSIKKIFKTIILIIILITIVCIVAMNFFPQAFNLFNRFENGNDSIETRIILYKYAWRLFLDKPILGNGINTFLSLTYVESSMVENTFVHNVILQLLCETGILGTVFIITPFFVTWGKTVNILRKKINYINNKKIIRGLMISLYVQTIFIMYFFSGNPIYDYNLLLAYFMFITIPININKSLKNNKEL